MTAQTQAMGRGHSGSLALLATGLLGNGFIVRNREWFCCCSEAARCWNSGMDWALLLQLFLCFMEAKSGCPNSPETLERQDPLPAPNPIRASRLRSPQRQLLYPSKASNTFLYPPRPSIPVPPDLPQSTPLPPNPLLPPRGAGGFRGDNCHHPPSPASHSLPGTNPGRSPWSWSRGWLRPPGLGRGAGCGDTD